MIFIIGILAIILLIFYIVGGIIAIINIKMYDKRCNKRLEELRKQSGFDRLQYFDIP